MVMSATVRHGASAVVGPRTGSPAPPSTPRSTPGSACGPMRRRRGLTYRPCRDEDGTGAAAARLGADGRVRPAQRRARWACCWPTPTLGRCPWSSSSPPSSWAPRDRSMEVVAGTLLVEVSLVVAPAVRRRRLRPGGRCSAAGSPTPWPVPSAGRCRPAGGASRASRSNRRRPPARPRPTSACASPRSCTTSWPTRSGVIAVQAGVGLHVMDTEPDGGPPGPGAHLPHEPVEPHRDPLAARAGAGQRRRPRLHPRPRPLRPGPPRPRGRRHRAGGRPRTSRASGRPCPPGWSWPPTASPRRP